MGKDLFTTEIFAQFDPEFLSSAEENLRYELLSNPKDNKKLEQLATLLYHKRDYDGAINLYLKIIDNDETARKYAFLGYLYFEKDDYQNAISYFEKSLDIDPKNAFVYFLLGNSYSRIGRVIHAVTNYDLAIFLNFDIYKAHVDFAQKYEQMGLFQRALKEYIIAYEIDPRNKEIKNKIESLKSQLR